MSSNVSLRRVRSLLALVLVLGLAAAPAAAASAPGLIVGVAPEAPGFVTAGGEALAPGVRLVRGHSGAAQRLEDAQGVRYVEPNRIVRAVQAPAGAPQLLARQWALGAINVMPAWAVPATGSVTVAVLDSGMDIAHPDLAPNVWRNSSPTVGDVNGYNVFTRSGDVRDQSGHGTAMAGLIGAAPAPGAATLGVSGVGRHVRLMPIKVLDRHGVGSTATVVAGMRYALSHGARVISLSLAGPDRSRALEDQIRAARAIGVFVVTAAGNDGLDVAAAPRYPAAYPQPNVIGVASTGPTGALSDFSNRGGSLSLTAPGEEILTTAPGAGYESVYGTSASAPQVAGAIALLEAARPDATFAQVQSALRDGARRVPALAGMVRAGQLDVGAAMARLMAQPISPCRGTPSRPKVRVVRRGQRHPTLHWNNNRAGSCRTRLVLSGGGSPRRQQRDFNAVRHSWVVRRAPGSYRWRMVGLDAMGRPGFARTGRVLVRSAAARARE